MNIDFKAVEGYNLEALKQELNSRQEQIKSLEWALNEHKTEVSKLEMMIAWKEQNDSKNGYNS